MARKIIIRFLAFGILLCGINEIYDRFFLEDDLQQYAPIVNGLRALPEDTRILYVGESSNVTISLQDLDQRSIGAFLSEYYPSLGVHELTQAAAHAGIFKVLLENIPEDSKVETVVLTLNLRSFNAEWIHSGLETPLQKGALLLGQGPALWRRFLLAFKHYPHDTEKERYELIDAAWKKEKLLLPAPFPYATTFEWRQHLEAEKSRHPEDKSLKLKHEFVSNYAFRIDPVQNPRIADFDEIIALAKKRKWKLVFNLMPENTDMARELGGEELLSIMRDNRNVLVHYFTQQGVQVVDNLELVRNANFVDKEWPTEHYNQKGRRAVALHLADALQSIYPKDYKAPSVARFSNDCEGQLQWGNLHTLTTEKAASGKYSSKTDSKNNFSLNFRYPFGQVPEGARNKVSVKMMVNGLEYSEKTLLILDVKRQNGEQYWKAIALNELTDKKAGWQAIGHTFDLSPVREDGTFVDIYLYNTSGKSLYVDDISIRFH